MHSDHLGYIVSCPSNLGTAIRAGALVKLPLLSARSDFKDLCKKTGLQARGTGGVDTAPEGGTYDLSNSDRIGKTENQLINIFIEGVANFVRWEMMLEKKEPIDAEINIVEPGVSLEHEEEGDHPLDDKVLILKNTFKGNGIGEDSYLSFTDAALKMRVIYSKKDAMPI